jgi:hypothetical protein
VWEKKEEGYQDWRLWNSAAFVKMRYHGKDQSKGCDLTLSPLILKLLSLDTSHLPSERSFNMRVYQMRGVLIMRDERNKQ